MREPIVLFDDQKQVKALLPCGEIKLIQINDREYNIVRTAHGIYVFEKRCPHMDYPLKNGKLNPFSEIVCPQHGYRFDLKTGDESDHKCRSLEVYQTRWTDQGLVLQDLRKTEKPND